MVMTKIARGPEASGNSRVCDFVDSFLVWMKDISAGAARDPAIAAALVELMKRRLAADLDAFIETELRLRAFERRIPEAALKLVGTDD
jgi:hypothetical protein